ncbi:hypothetical protein N752_13355 [Desulforamulus aquiferis]|nr:prepilin-type N-terminal cleavage/methylation domain-containing protein [Desulforamulus aquiferis]RYD04355.1 hypothetical protein N752_13355 [Desulforamulus aquiferis]
MTTKSGIANAKHRTNTIKSTNSRGFVFTELLVVLIIIAILVAIAVPFYSSAKQTSRDRVDQANIKILNSATLQWMLSDENNDPRGPGINTDSLKEQLEGVYIMEWPTSPNNNSYILRNGQWIIE